MLCSKSLCNNQDMLRQLQNQVLLMPGKPKKMPLPNRPSPAIPERFPGTTRFSRERWVLYWGSCWKSFPGSLFYWEESKARHQPQTWTEKNLVVLEDPSVCLSKCRIQGPTALRVCKILLVDQRSWIWKHAIEIDTGGTTNRRRQGQGNPLPRSLLPWQNTVHTFTTKNSLRTDNTNLKQRLPEEVTLYKDPSIHDIVVSPSYSAIVPKRHSFEQLAVDELLESSTVKN